jgi:transcriptional regulator with GAF, ATPase, and Fis domain
MTDLATQLARIAAVAVTQRQQGVMEQAVRSATAFTGATLALLLRLRAEHLEVRATIGLPRSALHRPVPVAAIPGLLPLVVRAAPAEATAQAVLDHVGLPLHGAAVVVGLQVESQPYGLLLLVRDRPWDGPDLAALDQMAEVIGLALLKVRLAWRLWRQEQILQQVEEDRAGTLVGDGPDPSQTRSPAMRNCLMLARQVAQADSPVLLSGGTGVGKEVLARFIHRWSARADRPFIAVNCATLPEGMRESELFGHVAGAFTGAVASRRGRFQAADGGTLLLDEVGELSAGAQAALLRVLQERRFEPVGSDRSVQVDVRILAATNRDLEAEMAAGRFRRDLWYRLSVFPLHIPALQQRREDIPLIAGTWLAQRAARSGRGPWTLAPEALERLQDYDWPGNVRELLNCLERATILQPAGALPHDYFPARRAAPPAERPVAGGSDAAAAIRAALHRCRGRIYGPLGAAVLLGLKPSTLQSRMRRLGIARVDALPGPATQ